MSADLDPGECCQHDWDGVFGDLEQHCRNCGAELLGGSGRFDEYCEYYGVQPGEKPAAFVVFLNKQTVWDEPMGKVQP